MSVNPTQAVAAYTRALRPDAGPGLEPRGEAAKGDFASALRDAAGGAIDSLRQSETATLKAAAGQADVTELVTAVSQAELTLQTVVAVRDRVIQAYQDILRMPI